MIGQGRVQVGCLAAVGIPSAVAFVSGLFVGLTVAAATLAWGDGDMAMNGIFFGTLGGLISWPFCLSWWGNILLGGKPLKTTERNYTYSTRLELVTNQGRTSNFIELPVSPEQLSFFTHGVLGGKSLTEAGWVGKGFTRSEFVDLRDALIEGNLGYWKNANRPQDGWDLTRAGKAAVKFLAGERGETPPLSKDGFTLLQNV